MAAILFPPKCVNIWCGDTWEGGVTWHQGIHTPVTAAHLPVTTRCAQVGQMDCRKSTKKSTW